MLCSEKKDSKMEKGRVCVTGGTGFLGSYLIKILLEDGYSVNTTIRSSANPERRNISYLTDLPGASERLQIFNADLEKPETFAPAIQECIGVFHVAHPIDFEAKETEESRIRKSVNGTLGILQACLDSKTVKRVVYTSSASTVVFNEIGLDPMDETIWSDVDYIRRDLAHHRFASYAITKIFVEKAALEFAEKNGLHLVSIIPTWIHGPFISPSVPGSVRSSMALIFGHEEGYGYLVRTPFVHTEDVARAHIFLFENPNAKGRYICSAVDLTIEELSECLSAKYPNQYPIPSADSLKDIGGSATASVSSKKLLDLGFKFSYGIEEMFDDAIECCKQKESEEIIKKTVNRMVEKGRICVTGGTGFLASWLIKSLLRDGYSVNTTIRPSSRKGSNNDYLRNLPGASERLQIFNADLAEPESFAPAIEGCIGVFHLAHPVDFEGKEAEDVRIQKSVNGIIGILQACLNSKTVKRVVYTSSSSTVLFTDKDQVDERTWSDVDVMRKKISNQLVASYALTKMLAEQAAMEFAEKNGLDLVTIVPTWIHGPFICPFLPDSVQKVMSLIFGHKEDYGKFLRGRFVHTDDVARAHIFLFEFPDAKGRYICSGAELTLEKMAEFLSARYPEYRIPNAESLKDVTGFEFPANMSTKKLLDAGFKYNYGIAEMFDDAIECCKQNGFL